jgi:hypothetical protein
VEFESYVFFLHLASNLPGEARMFRVSEALLRSLNYGANKSF